MAALSLLEHQQQQLQGSISARAVLPCTCNWTATLLHYQCLNCTVKAHVQEQHTLNPASNASYDVLSWT
jgi:hypothetical protein